MDKLLQLKRKGTEGDEPGIERIGGVATIEKRRPQKKFTYRENQPLCGGRIKKGFNVQGGGDSMAGGGETSGEKGEGPSRRKKDHPHPVWGWVFFLRKEVQSSSKKEKKIRRGFAIKRSIRRRSSGRKRGSGDGKRNPRG